MLVLGLAGYGMSRGLVALLRSTDCRRSMNVYNGTVKMRQR